MSRHAARPDRRRLAWAWGAFLGGTLFVVGSLWLAFEPDAPRTGVMPTGTPSQSGSPKPSVSTTAPKASPPASRPPSSTPAPTPTTPAPRPSQTTQSPSPTPTTATPDPVPDSITNQALAKINAQRSAAGAGPLAVYSGMGGYAQDWAEEMARADTLVHSPHNPYSAEVIASGASDAQTAVNLWLNSPPHREIILNPAYDKVGIGYADGYWCAVFS